MLKRVVIPLRRHQGVLECQPLHLTQYLAHLLVPHLRLRPQDVVLFIVPVRSVSASNGWSHDHACDLSLVCLI